MAESVTEWLETPTGQRWSHSHHRRLRFLGQTNDTGSWIYYPGPLYQIKDDAEWASPMNWSTRDLTRWNEGMDRHVRVPFDLGVIAWPHP